MIVRSNPSSRRLTWYIHHSTAAPFVGGTGCTGAAIMTTWRMRSLAAARSAASLRERRVIREHRATFALEMQRRVDVDRRGSVEIQLRNNLVKTLRVGAS